MKFSRNIQHHIQYTWKSLFRSIKPLICNICTNLFLQYVFHVLLIWVALFWKPFILHLFDCPTRRGKPNQIYWFSLGNLLVFSNQCFHKLPCHSLICAATPSTSFWILPFVLSVLMSTRKILGKSQTTAHNVSIMTIEKRRRIWGDNHEYKWAPYLCSTQTNSVLSKSHFPATLWLILTYSLSV